MKIAKIAQFWRIFKGSSLYKFHENCSKWRFFKEFPKVVIVFNSMKITQNEGFLLLVQRDCKSPWEVSFSMFIQVQDELDYRELVASAVFCTILAYALAVLAVKIKWKETRTTKLSKTTLFT